jgi:hypothetical protein
MPMHRVMEMPGGLLQDLGTFGRWLAVGLGQKECSGTLLVDLGDGIQLGDRVSVDW